MRDSLFWAIITAKHTHDKKVSGYFKATEHTQSMWQVITNYSTSTPASDSDALNDFYTRFEAFNDLAMRKTTQPPAIRCSA